MEPKLFLLGPKLHIILRLFLIPWYGDPQFPRPFHPHYVLFVIYMTVLLAYLTLNFASFWVFSIVIKIEVCPHKIRPEFPETVL
jgi:hypothetical protein